MSHTGVGDEQSEFDLHPTHWFIDVSHTGVGTEQSAFVLQATHSWAILHAGVGAKQLLSVTQFTHWPVGILQTWMPEHSSSVRHPAQKPVVDRVQP